MPDASDTGMGEGVLLPTIPSLQRLALAYAPASTRQPTLALLALDSRLAGLVRGASEPLLAQIRLAWWRDRLGEERASGPVGEPVLAALRDSGIDTRELLALVDGWEAMSGEHPLQPSAFEALADGRGKAFAALAAALGHGECRDMARRHGRAWAFADLAERVGAGERDIVTALAASGDLGEAGLPRALRPLAVLLGVSRRRLRRGASGPGLAPGDLLAAMRLGIFGR